MGLNCWRVELWGSGITNNNYPLTINKAFLGRTNEKVYEWLTDNCYLLSKVWRNRLLILTACRRLPATIPQKGVCRPGGLQR